MKRERYFQDELRKMFVSYAVIPVFVFTLVCGVIFMAAFLYGRLSITRRQNHLVAQELTRVLTGYQDGLKELSAIPGLLEADSGEVSGEASRSRIAGIQRQIYEIVYRLQNEIGYEAEFHVLDQNGNEIGYEVGTGDSRTSISSRITVRQWMHWGGPEPAPGGCLRRWIRSRDVL